MTTSFFDQPILNSPYEYPDRHWELDESGQPTDRIVEKRRGAKYITPVPKPKRRSGQQDIVFKDAEGLSTEDQQFDQTPIINEVRRRVDLWRQIPSAANWRVTPETARLLQHWRHHKFSGIRPFFCQVEAVETAIWLTEVAPKLGKQSETLLNHLNLANERSNPGLNRLALKLATGAGKTAVMAMLIAWQTVNAVRRPNSPRFTKGFLVITPGITIRDRLRVLQPNDPDSYFKHREIVPQEMLQDIGSAKIVITNYHAFKLRETLDIARGTRSLLQGRGEEIATTETEGQMLQRVMPDLLGMKNILVLNDEAHHCYREKPEEESEENKLKGDEKKEAEKNTEAARLWISGIEAVTRKIGTSRVFDLSATPFFLQGSGYPEGTLFPWTMCDFSLMDAIECGIVKLPRVPIADNIPEGEMPMFRNLWEHIGKDMPKKGRGKNADLDPLDLPPQLQTALEALYGHYKETFELWQKEGIGVPPCFIVVCNNTASSKLVYDYISGFERTGKDGVTRVTNGRLELFRNYDNNEEPLARPNTLLIDSEQLESGDALDANFRDVASDEIERFKRERLGRSGDRKAAENISDQEILREVMNTVGKKGQLGESIRCVVSVSMLTEGWDANTVTHVLGVRAFRTQLLCEQVIGRALRRQSYELNDDGKFNVEYADVLGIPFDFNAKPVVAKPNKPRETVHVRAMSPQRDALAITFPRVAGYRVDLPDERLEAKFNDDSTLELTPKQIGATKTQNAGIVGETADLSLDHTETERQSTILFHLTKRLIETNWRDADGEPRYELFGQLKRIAKQWLDNHLVCKGGTYPAQILVQQLTNDACQRITDAITVAHMGETAIKAVLDTYNPTGSTHGVSFTTTKTERWQTAVDKSHVDWAILDSGWEGEFCRVAEADPRVKAYVKNHGLNFEVPYRDGSDVRRYIPDYILLIDDGKPPKPDGTPDLLHLIVEIKGYRGEDAKLKKSTMETYWVPGVNHLKSYGRWDFVEFTEPYEMEENLAAKITEHFDAMIDEATHAGTETA